HAYNPVHWYSWGEDAFEKAKKENKPIFLSVGYSTCHWCHVMAHESFENEEIAALLNKYFISIKVDREQRPDIDAVYMSATQLINGNGGWPMTVFLDNDLRPFHAATYYPPFSTPTRTGLKDVLLKIKTLWKEQPELIDQVATNVTANITALADETMGAGKLQDDINELALKQIASSFDEEAGGFSAAPKFPRPGIFSFLNHLSLADTKNSVTSPQTMMRRTLDAMATGGIYDQIAGGFHRYSVDANWQVPHFEKMLYSQALMAISYTNFYRIEPQERYKKIVSETLDFVAHEMRSSEGGFYSALDADSERPDKSGEHSEGAYYLWHESELKKLLSKSEFGFVEKYFHIREEGNILSDPQEEFTDLNIFYIDEEYKNEKLTEQQEKWLASVKKKLNTRRLQRPRPHLDDKVLTAWNGMMVTAFAKASKVFDEPIFLSQAIQTLSFIKHKLYDTDSKKLFRQYRENKASAEATLSDYAWLIRGAIEVYQASGDIHWLDWVYELQKVQDELFLDVDSGAYFESIATDARLLFRSKSIYDGALPAANAIVLSNLRILADISKTAVQKKAFSSRADRLVSSFASVVNENPASASMLLSAEIK
ncbi:MAG TPA: thioredoxin domain-containing protein, partial [Gammaproteobacteria bacterium]|nr:thioredoxin domain-containing protein [Gammaproteobacteria bacterium]